MLAAPAASAAAPRLSAAAAAPLAPAAAARLLLSLLRGLLKSEEGVNIKQST